MTGPRRASSRTILATSRMQSLVASEEPPNLRIFIARNQCSRECDEDRGAPQILSAHFDEFLAIALGDPTADLRQLLEQRFPACPGLVTCLFVTLANVGIVWLAGTHETVTGAFVNHRLIFFAGCF